MELYWPRRRVLLWLEHSLSFRNFQGRCYSRRAKRMAAGREGETGPARSPLDHPEDIHAMHRLWDLDQCCITAFTQRSLVHAPLDVQTPSEMVYDILMRRKRRARRDADTEVFLSVNSEGHVVVMTAERYAQALAAASLKHPIDRPEFPIDDSGKLKAPRNLLSYLR